MIDANKAKNLLEEHDAYFRSKHWFSETYVKTDGFHFNLRHQLNGCSIVDSYQALQFLYETLREEDEEVDEVKPRLSDEDVLLRHGYEMICESPLEIASIDDQHVFVSGEAAVILLSSLRNITK
jgi:hypothetical protein